jgi:hypothetical protein
MLAGLLVTLKLLCGHWQVDRTTALGWHPQLSRDELDLELIARLEREFAARIKARKAQTDVSQACINSKPGMKLCSVEALKD